ncbi:MAG: 50S ribosomal protein L15 [bacterium]
MILLNNLQKIKLQNSKRVGRGGNRGKNSGNGNKGQQKRAGKTRIGFEGGQKSLIRRTPKIKGYNFSGKRNLDLKTFGSSTIAKLFTDNDVISIASLREKGLINEKTKRVRIIKSSGVDFKPKVDANDTSIYLTKGLQA